MKKEINGAHAFMLSLIEEGVDTIFGYPGGAIMPVFDALYDYRDKINQCYSPCSCNYTCSKFLSYFYYTGSI